MKKAKKKKAKKKVLKGGRREELYGYEIRFNGKYRGLYRRSGADAKLTKLMGRREWMCAIFPSCSKYSARNGDVITVTNVGCYRCARADRKKGLD